MMYPRTKLVLVFLLCSLASSWASAHLGAEPPTQASFVSGFLHPLGGLDHLTVMLGLGLWGALVARRARGTMQWAPAGFVGMLLLGAMMGLHGVALPGVEPMLACSVVVTGLLVASRWHVPGFALALLVGTFAVIHGLAHGHELAASSQAVPALAGLMLASSLLCATGWAMGCSLRGVSHWVTRYLGIALALLGGVLWSQLV